MLQLCVIAVLCALAGLGAVAMSLGMSLPTPVLLAAPAFGAGSLGCGLAAAVIALRQ